MDIKVGDIVEITDIDLVYHGFSKGDHVKVTVVKSTTALRAIYDGLEQNLSIRSVKRLAPIKIKWL